MKLELCNRCNTQTGHKRDLGIGTLIMIFLTCGFWLFVIPFYPVRCKICGTPGKGISAGLAVVIIIVGMVIASHFMH